MLSSSARSHVTGRRRVVSPSDLNSRKDAATTASASLTDVATMCDSLESRATRSRQRHAVPLTVAAARSRLLHDADAQPIHIDRVPLDEAFGAVLARAAPAKRSSPPWDSAAIDGIAIDAPTDIPAGSRWRVTGTVLAGADPKHRAGTGAAAVLIMTGAPVPKRFNTVIPIELLEFDSTTGEAVLLEATPSGGHIRRAGEGVHAGEIVVDAGEVLTSFHIAALAAGRTTTVPIFRAPVIQVLITGAEVVLRSPRATQIVDAIGPMFLRLVRSAGGNPRPLLYVGDDADALTEALRAACVDADVVITTGGAGPGIKDLVLSAIATLGEADQWHLALKPGKPFVFGRIAKTMVLGLPGNPGAAIASFVLLAAPLIRRLAGCTDLDPGRLTALATSDMRRAPDGRLHALRARVSCSSKGQLLVRVPPGQGSHQLREAAEANAIALLPDGHGTAIGQPVEVVLLQLPFAG